MDHFTVKEQEQFSNPYVHLTPKYVFFFQQNSPSPLLKHIACISFYLFYQNVNFQNYATVSITCFMTEFDGAKVYSSFDVINCFVCTFTINPMQCSLWCQMRNIPMPPVIWSWNKWCLACRKCQHFIKKEKKRKKQCISNRCKDTFSERKMLSLLRLNFYMKSYNKVDVFSISPSSFAQHDVSLQSNLSFIWHKRDLEKEEKCYLVHTMLWPLTARSQLLKQKNKRCRLACDKVFV